MATLRACALAVGWWLLGCGLLSSCVSQRPDCPDVAIGARGWLGPNGEGTLDLRRDATFVLAILSSEGHSSSFSGIWTWQSGRWPVDGNPLVHDPNNPGMVTLRIGTTTGETNMAVGTNLMALLDTDSATYFGVDGVVDLNWGM